jgi:DNA-directed RNA polymerase sigma subunit (sigma70/sigma32)
MNQFNQDAMLEFDRRLRVIPRTRGRTYTQMELAEALGISKARVMQLEQNALKKMARHPLIQEVFSQWDFGEGRRE